jgi:hypothetical protein
MTRLANWSAAHPFRLIAAAILLVSIVDKGPWA